jgi:hypothetical protein
VIVGRLLEEGHRPGAQRTFPVASRIPRAEHDDRGARKICQASPSFKDQETVTSRQSEIEDDQICSSLRATVRAEMGKPSLYSERPAIRAGLLIVGSNPTDASTARSWDFGLRIRSWQHDARDLSYHSRVFEQMKEI